MPKKESKEDDTRKPVGLMLWNRLYGRLREEDARDALWAAAVGGVVALGMWIFNDELDPTPHTVSISEQQVVRRDAQQQLIRHAGELSLAPLSSHTGVPETEHRQDYK